jgi:hypothetical protein
MTDASGVSGRNPELTERTATATVTATARRGDPAVCYARD